MIKYQLSPVDTDREVIPKFYEIISQMGGGAQPFDGGLPYTLRVHCIDLVEINLNIGWIFL